MNTKARDVNSIWVILFIIAFIIAIAFLARPLMRLVRNIDEFRAWILSFGGAGIVVFIAIQILQVVVFVVPGEVVQIAGGFLYGTLWGTILSVIGITLGSLICFGLARLLGRQVIESIIGYQRVHKFDSFINTSRGETLLFLIFLIPGLPKDVLSYAAGLTPIRFGYFFFITLMARLPGIFLSAYWGANMAEKNYWAAIIIAVLAAVLFLLGVFRGEAIIKHVFNRWHDFRKR